MNFKELNGLFSRNTDFNCGEIIFNDCFTGISSAIKKYAPFGKVAIICFENTFGEFGKTINELCQGLSVKVSTIIVEKQQIDTVENGASLFNLPEDVRLIIVLDGELMNVACYYGGIRVISVCFVVRELVPDFLLPVRLNLQNGCKIDEYQVDAQRVFVFDENLILKNPLSKAEAYAGVMSKLIALYDYRINCTAKGIKANREAYELMRTAVTNAFEIFNYSESEQFEKLVTCAFQTAIANGLSGGEIFACASPSIAGKYFTMNSERNEDLQKEKIEKGASYNTAEFYCFLKIIEIYAQCLGLKDVNILNIMNYNQDALNLSEFAGVDRFYLLNGYLRQSQKINKNIEEINAITLKVAKEADATRSAVGNLSSTYLALGGVPLNPQLKPRLKTALKYAGDLPNYINGMTMLRERGVTSLF